MTRTSDGHAGSRSRLIRHLRARPRLWASFALGAAIALVLPSSLVSQPLTRGLIGWNVGALLYLALVLVMMFRADPEKMRWRARLQDEGRNTILILVCVTIVAVLLAIGLQLSYARKTEGVLKLMHVGLAGLTVATAWWFVQTIFALHYAHEYQMRRSYDSPALQFPGNETPDYLDFLYVACVVGTSGQTADVAFASRRMRRVGLVHCVLAFVFNTTLLAMTINVAAGLF